MDSAFSVAAGRHSTSPTFPNLAAQQQAYLVAQIQAFKNGRRGEQEAHDYMLGMTTLIWRNRHARS